MKSRKVDDLAIDFSHSKAMINITIPKELLLIAVEYGRLSDSKPRFCSFDFEKWQLTLPLPGKEFIQIEVKSDRSLLLRFCVIEDYVGALSEERDWQGLECALKLAKRLCEDSSV